MAAFASYILNFSKDPNSFNASTAFVSMSLFKQIRMPLFLLPMMAAHLMQVNYNKTKVTRFAF